MCGALLLPPSLLRVNEGGGASISLARDCIVSLLVTL